MTRARNLAGLGTVTAQPTTTTPIHLGPLGVGTFARIYGTWEHDQINSVSIGTTQLQISGITTGLNVSGIITAQNGLNLTGNITNGLNVSAGIATLQAITATTATFSGDATFQGSVSIAGTATYEDITDIDSVGVITARRGIIVAGVSTVNGGLNVSGNIVNGLNVTAGIVTVNDYIQHAGNSDTSIRFPSDDTFSVETVGSERLRIGSSGPVGINTNNTIGVGAKLRVGTQFLAAGNSVADGGIVIVPETGSTIATGQVMPMICAAGQGANPGIARAGIAAVSTSGRSSMDLLFLTRYGADGTDLDVTTDEKVRITSAGKVGIGLTNPSAKLQVASGHINVDSGYSFQWGDTYERIEQSDGKIEFFTNNGEQMTLSGSRLLLGTTSDTSPIGWGNNLQVAGTSAAAGVSIRRDSSDTGGALLVFGKTRGSLNGNTVVQSGDQIGGLYFAGGDGTDVNSIGAQISVEVDGTPGSNDMPGRILFKTTANNAASPTERLRITEAGLVGINCTPNKQLEVKGTDVAFRLLSTVATGRIGMEFYDTSAQKGFFGYASSSNDEMSIQQNEAADLYVYVNGGERLRIDSSGVLYHKPEGDTTETYLKAERSGETYILKAQKDGSVDTNFAVAVQDGGSLKQMINIDGGLNGKVGINTDIPNFAQSTPMSTYNMQVGVEGSITLASMSTSSTTRAQLQFYRRAGYATGSSMSSHTMGDIAWYGSSNDADNSNMAWSLGCTGTGGSWTSGANRTASMIGTNHDGEMWRFTQYGVFVGRAVFDDDSTSGNSRWTTSGDWKNVVDLSGWPSQTLYMCDAAMQYSNAYLATFWVYKTRQSAYQVIVDLDSLCHWRMDGSVIQIQQNSGVDQTNTTGYQKVYQVTGMK